MVYDLIEGDTYLVTAGYSDEMRARIIDRWQGLERGTRAIVEMRLPYYGKPRTQLIANTGFRLAIVWQGSGRLTGKPPAIVWQAEKSRRQYIRFECAAPGRGRRRIPGTGGVLESSTRFFGNFEVLESSIPFFQ